MKSNRQQLVCGVFMVEAGRLASSALGTAFSVRYPMTDCSLVESRSHEPVSHKERVMMMCCGRVGAHQ